MDYFTRFTRITISGHLPDRYLTTQVKLVLTDEKINKGSIFAIVEIDNPWFSSSQIGQSIINALVREYGRSSNSSDLINFELSLKKVNETLGRITQNGETEWIGKINSCLALICNDQIHLAKTGKAEVFLIRNNRISSITEGFNQNPDLHPLKTFSDIISGSLKPNDKIFITTPQIFDYFSQENLKQVISKNDTYQASLEIANRLIKEREKKVSAIIIELLSKEDLTNCQTADYEETVYLDQKAPLGGINLDTKKILSGLKPLVEKSSKYLKLLVQKTGEFIETLKPKTRRFKDSAITQLKKTHAHINEKILPHVRKTIKPISEKISHRALSTLRNNEFLQKNLNVKLYDTKNNYKIQLISQKFNNFLLKMKHSLQRMLIWFFDPKNRSIIYIIIVIILSGILIASISNLRGKQSQKEQEQSAVTTINELKVKLTDDYKLAILYNDKEKARNILTDIIDKAKTVSTKDNDLSTQISQISSQAQDELDKLNNVTRIKNLQSITDFVSPAHFIDTHDYIFALNSGSGIVTTSTKTNAYKQDINLSSSKTITLASSEEGDSAYLLTDKNQLFLVKNPLEQPTEIKLASDSWKSGISLEIFSGNIYLLDANGNQIWKYNYTQDGFSSAQSYLSTGVDIGDGVDLAIDGAIYVLKKDGQIIKLSKGRQQDYKISNIPKPDEKITNPQRIYTNADANYIYVLDGNRLLELEKSGKFVAQYVFDGLNELKDFSLNTKTKEIWLLNENKIYKGNL